MMECYPVDIKLCRIYTYTPYQLLEPLSFNFPAEPLKYWAACKNFARKYNGSQFEKVHLEKNSVSLPVKLKRTSTLCEYDSH